MHTMRQLQKAVNKKEPGIDVEGKKREFELSKASLTSLVHTVKHLLDK